MLQLQYTEGRIDFAHLAIDDGRHDRQFVDNTKVLQLVDAQFRLRIRANDGTAFEGIKYLGGMETEHGQVAAAQNAAALVLYPEGMCRVVNDAQIVIISNFLDRIHVTWVAIAMHGHDGGGLWRDGSFDFFWIEVERIRIDVHKHRLDAVPQQGVGGRDEGIRGGNHFTRNSQRLQGGNQGNGTVGKQREMFHAQIRTQRLFQLLVKWTAIRQYLAIPYFFQVWQELVQRR